MDKYKHTILSDPLKNTPLDPLDGLPEPPQIRHQFRTGFASLEEFRNYLQRRPNGSAPGINMIPYKVYKACEELSRYLYNIMVSCYKDKRVPINWRTAREIYIPKSDTPFQTFV